MQTKRRRRGLVIALCLILLLGVTVCLHPRVSIPLGLRAGAPVIPLLTFSGTEEIHTLYSSFLASDPAYFYVAPYYAVGTRADGGVAYLKPVYRWTGKELAKAKEDYEARLSDILAPAKILPTRREQVGYLHDYLISQFLYDRSETVYDPYTMLLTGRGVCQAFSLLFCDLCSRLDIPCEVTLCFSMQHQWNRVYVDGEWLALDLVWDAGETGVTGVLSRRYFLLSDAELLALRVARDPAWEAI